MRDERRGLTKKQGNSRASTLLQSAVSADFQQFNYRRKKGQEQEFRYFLRHMTAPWPFDRQPARSVNERTRTLGRLIA